jgi:predicted nucleotidyltransferase
LFGVNEEALYIREIERRSGLSIGTIRQEALKLVRMGLVLSRKSGNRTYYEPNKKNVLYEDIRHIVLKTCGLPQALTNKLGERGILFAFIFGSIASGTEKPDSDVDLMIIGEIGLREVSKRLSSIGKDVGREINPHVMTGDEFSKRLNQKEHFVTAVMDSPRIWIKGCEDDFKAMVR